MILCLGTTPTVQRTMTFASLAIDEVNRALNVVETASGKAINSARVLHTLGEPVLATGFLGGDSGAFIRRDLDQNGIAHAFVEVSPRTRTCVTAINQADGTATELVEESAPVEPAAYEALAGIVDSNLRRAKAIVMSGTLPPGADDGFYARLVTMAAEARVPAVVDAKGIPLRKAAAARPMVVKPNRAELAATVGVAIDSADALRDAIRRLIDLGPAWVVVTMGAEGAMASDGKSFWQIDPPKITVVSPIGSGDSFTAGLAAGIVRGREVPDACRLAAACAAANAMVPVAGLVRREDVERLEREIPIRKVSV